MTLKKSPEEELKEKIVDVSLVECEKLALQFVSKKDKKKLNKTDLVRLSDALQAVRQTRRIEFDKHFAEGTTLNNEIKKARQQELEKYESALKGLNKLCEESCKRARQQTAKEIFCWLDNIYKIKQGNYIFEIYNRDYDAFKSKFLEARE